MMPHAPTLLVFVVTYVLIAFRRLSLLPIGRPAGALVGACGMVVIATINPKWGIDVPGAFAAVEPNTIGLLFGMMLISGAFAEAGFFDYAAKLLVARKLSPVAMLYATTIGAGILSALLVNDPVCVLGAPVVDAMARRARVDRVPYLFGLAMGANAGSAMTLAGNPQNMLVAHLSGLSYRDYLVRGGPAGFLALLVTAAVLHWFFRKRLTVRDEVPTTTEAETSLSKNDVVIASVIMLGVSIAFLLGANLAFAALTGSAVLLMLRRRDPASLFSGVTWTVLVFFAALFIVAAAFQRTGLAESALEATKPFMPRNPHAATASLAAILTLGCQVVSNVPFILLGQPFIQSLPDPTLAWTTTALATTLAGNLTLLGSVANIIVIETAKAEDEMGFVAYIKVGVPVTVTSLVVGIGYLLVTG
jgi:Na+/H+ antiporter NhaD/arsenite permease-like protein